MSGQAAASVRVRPVSRNWTATETIGQAAPHEESQTVCREPEDQRKVDGSSFDLPLGRNAPDGRQVHVGRQRRRGGEQPEVPGVEALGHAGAGKWR